MFRFAGIVTSKPPQEATSIVTKMLQSMVRTPKESLELCSFPRSGICIGWIGAGSSEQIFASRVLAREGAVLVFSGEHFVTNATVDTQSTPAKHAIDSLISARGGALLSQLAKLNGWFSGAVADDRAGTVTLFTDRYGLRRLHFSSCDGEFLFSSEAKAILATGLFRADWDRVGLAEYLSCGAVLEGRTLFTNVHVMPPASAWTVGRGNVPQRVRYFSPLEWELLPELSSDEFHERLRAALERIIPQYLLGAPRPAISLTGGIDSRLIAAFGGDAARGMSAYTYAGIHRDCHDVKIARRVSAVCGYDHQTLRIGSDFLAEFPAYAEETVWATDGTLGISASHEVYLSRKASRISEIRVTGNYGSELLRAVTAFKPFAFPENLVESDIVEGAREAAKTVIAGRNAHPVTFAAFTELPWHLFGRLNAGQAHLVPRSPYTDNELVALAYQAPAGARRNTPFWGRLIADGNVRLAGIPTDRGYVSDIPGFLTLPNRLYLYATAKAEWYYEEGLPHYLAGLDSQFSMSSSPPFPFGTHKIEGYRRWFRDDLAAYLRSVISDSSASNVPGIRWDRARDLVEAHCTGRANFVREVSMLCTLALAQRLLVAAASPSPSVSSKIHLREGARETTDSGSGRGGS